VTNRENWSCNVEIGQPPAIASAFSNGRPVARLAGLTAPFHAVAKWKWWALRLGIPGFGEADY
jgi:hypothetical protein